MFNAVTAKLIRVDGPTYNRIAQLARMGHRHIIDQVRLMVEEFVSNHPEYKLVEPAREGEGDYATQGDRATV